MGRDPPEVAPEEAPDAPRRGTPWFLLGLWLILACVGSGVVAQMLRMPSLWGGSSAVLEYMLPLPLTWGMLHWPSLGGFGALIVVAYRDPGRWLGLVRLACIGALLGTGVALLMSDALRGFPLLVYVGVDASATLFACGLVGIPEHVELRGWPPRVRTAVLLGPAVLVAGALVLGPYLQPRYKVSMSDVLDLGAGRGVVRFWAYSRRAAGESADECPHLAALAEERRENFPRRDGERHRMILLFRGGERVSGRNPGGAWVTYEWWPDGREYCSADSSFRPAR